MSLSQAAVIGEHEEIVKLILKNLKSTETLAKQVLAGCKITPGRWNTRREKSSQMQRKLKSSMFVKDTDGWTALMYAVTTEDEELVSLIANTGKQEAAAPANKDDQRALEIAQVPYTITQNR